MASIPFILYRLMSCTSGYTRKYCNKAEQNIDESILGCERVASHGDFKVLRLWSVFSACAPCAMKWCLPFSSHYHDTDNVLQRWGILLQFQIYYLHVIKFDCETVKRWLIIIIGTHHVLLSADLESHDVPSSKIHVNSVCLNRWQPEYWIWDCYISYHVNISSPFVQGLDGKKDKLLSW